MSAPKAPYRLNRRLVLEAPQRSSDGAGGHSESWTALGSHWAALAPRSGRAAGQDGSPVSRQAWRIVLRAAPEGSPARPRPGQRFREGARLYLIEAVAEADAQGRYLLCQAAEEVTR